MRTILTGSRNLTRADYMDTAIKCCGWTITSALHTGERGMPRCGQLWAKSNKIETTCERAYWNGRGQSIDWNAGRMRNRRLVLNADALVAVWDGVSVGTKDLIETAHELGLRVFVLRVHARRGACRAVPRNSRLYRRLSPDTKIWRVGHDNTPIDARGRNLKEIKRQRHLAQRMSAKRLRNYSDKQARLVSNAGEPVFD